jgi:23S rRNA (uridine2552-2'-O)-methyltransferase
MARYEPQDKFYRKARAKGLPSRAAFKLEELLARFKLLPKNARVIDLGCAPGGWLAILANAARGSSRIVGIDLTACVTNYPNVTTIVGDLRDPETQAAAVRELSGPADLITSDLAPKLTGIRDRDQAHSRELLEAALTLANAALRPDGSMIAKVFMGDEFEAIRELFTSRFKRIELVRTRATRPGSTELYLIARNFCGVKRVGQT